MPQYLSVKKWRRERKVSCILKMGGKCERCGYDKIQFPGAFDFHHIDPKTKMSGGGMARLKNEDLYRELKKCQLLCRNCHAEIHDVPWTIGDRRKVVRKPKYKCKVCNKDTPNKQYCSTTCSFNRNHILKKNVEELKRLVGEIGAEKTAEKLGVSRRTVSRWIKEAEINAERS